MSHEVLEREIYVDATPEIVFEVVSSPAHVQEWWPDEASYDPAPGGAGTIRFGDPADGGHVAAITVVDARPHDLFSFRWTHPTGEPATAANSLLVVFALTPSGSGTLLRLTETGFTGRGLADADALAEYEDHESGWDHFLPRLPTYVATLVAQDVVQG